VSKRGQLIDEIMALQSGGEVNGSGFFFFFLKKKKWGGPLLFAGLPVVGESQVFDQGDLAQMCGMSTRALFSGRRQATNLEYNRFICVNLVWAHGDHGGDGIPEKPAVSSPNPRGSTPKRFEWGINP